MRDHGREVVGGGQRRKHALAVPFLHFLWLQVRLLVQNLFQRCQLFIESIGRLLRLVRLVLPSFRVVGSFTCFAACVYLLAVLLLHGGFWNWRQGWDLSVGRVSVRLGGRREGQRDGLLLLDELVEEVVEPLVIERVEGALRIDAVFGVLHFANVVALIPQHGDVELPGKKLLRLGQRPPRVIELRLLLVFFLVAELRRERLIRHALPTRRDSSGHELPLIKGFVRLHLPLLDALRLLSPSLQQEVVVELLEVPLRLAIQSVKEVLVHRRFAQSDALQLQQQRDTTKS
mmetsp:Transcript_919/g.3832  ORF Transcript_919/g.3832 Transcript_919/m.3832 type:complete len:288 (+) Transcript_919:1938-2801(+)